MAEEPEAQDEAIYEAMKLAAGPAASAPGINTARGVGDVRDVQAQARSIVAPPQTVVAGVEMDGQYGRNGTVSYLKTVRNREAEIGIILVADDKQIIVPGAAFEPGPDVPVGPIKARRMASFGDAEVVQIVKFRSSAGPVMHLYRTDLPGALIAFQCEGGPLVAQVVIVAQRYQAWEKGPMAAFANITEDDPWAIGGGKHLGKLIEGFLDRVRERYS